jgi:hypothetical protein
MNMIEEIFGEQARAFDEAFKLIGGIAIEHAKLEEMLDYLLWQLTCYETSLRRGSTGKPRQELQWVFRRTRQTIFRAHRVMSQRVALISKQLAQPRIRCRLSEITYKDFAAAWPVLQTRLVNASEQRRDIIHSAIDWSGGQLTRTVGGVIDGQSSPLDLKRDEAFLNDLRRLFVDITVFTQDLGHFLPYAADDQLVVMATELF